MSVRKRPVSRKEHGQDKRRTGKKSGWVKPDGTPLRKRKGDYFPDKEIDKRKPALRSRAVASQGDTEHTTTRPEADRNPRTAERREKVFEKTGKVNRNEGNRSREKGSFKEYRSRPGKKFAREKTRHPSDPSAERSEPAPSGSERRKPFEKKRERYADRDHSKEMRGRFDKRDQRPDTRRYERKPKSTHTHTDSYGSKPVRLNKFIANAGICSRREADDLITAGVISINGQIVTELGTKVMPGDEVKFHDQPLRTEKMVYVLLNKPKDYITTTDDPEERKTVMNLVHDAGRERIFPVGRLDRNTTGLLLITNDGEMTRRLTHPSSNIKKIYQVELDRNISQQDMIRAAEGVELEDGIASVDEIHYESPTDKNIVGVELHSGRNRVVRRIFESMGYKVKKLDRVYFAGLTKKDLPRGRWRFLTDLEISMLKMQTGKRK